MILCVGTLGPGASRNKPEYTAEGVRRPDSQLTPFWLGTSPPQGCTSLDEFWGHGVKRLRLD